MKALLLLVVWAAGCGGRLADERGAAGAADTGPAVEDDGAAEAAVKPPETGHVWSRGFAASMISAAADSKGAALVVGYISADTDFGGGLLRHAGKDDLYVLKLDLAGKHVFSKRFGDGETQQAGRIACDDAGNFAFTGSTRGRIDLGGGVGGPVPTGDPFSERHSFIARFSSSGEHLWSKHLPTVDRARALAVSPGGDIVFGGWASAGTSDLPLGGPGGFIARLRSDGSLVFARTLGKFEASALAFDRDGGLVVAGSLEGTADFGAGPILRRREREGLTARLDAAGKPRWTYRTEGAGGDAHYAVALSLSGEVYVGGAFSRAIDFGGGPLVGGDSSGPDDAFVVALSADGAHRWSRGFGGPTRMDAAASLVVDRDQNLYVGGLFSQTITIAGSTLVSQGQTDAFLISFDAMGKHRWGHSWGGTGLDSLNTVAIGGDDRLTVSGWNESPVDLGGGPLSPLGMYVGKLAR